MHAIPTNTVTTAITPRRMTVFPPFTFLWSLLASTQVETACW